MLNTDVNVFVTTGEDVLFNPEPCSSLFPYQGSMEQPLRFMVKVYWKLSRWITSPYLGWLGGKEQGP